jgi:hypothetical protein
LTPCVLHRVGYDRSEQTGIGVASAASPERDQIAMDCLGVQYGATNAGLFLALYQDVLEMKESTATKKKTPRSTWPQSTKRPAVGDRRADHQDDLRCVTSMNRK